MSLLSWCRPASTAALCALQMLAASAAAADRPRFDGTGTVPIGSQVVDAPRHERVADGERRAAAHGEPVDRRRVGDGERTRGDGDAAIDVAGFGRLAEPIGITLGFTAIALAFVPLLRRLRRLQPSSDG